MLLRSLEEWRNIEVVTLYHTVEHFSISVCLYVCLCIQSGTVSRYQHIALVHKMLLKTKVMSGLQVHTGAKSPVGARRQASCERMRALLALRAWGHFPPLAPKSMQAAIHMWHPQWEGEEVIKEQILLQSPKGMYAILLSTTQLGPCSVVKQEQD